MQEQTALAALYAATDGPNWSPTPAGWDATGAVCGGQATGDTIICTNGFVTRIELADTNLVGTLPPELAYLTSLEAIFMNTNSISGTVPVDIFNSLPTLVDIRLNDNAFTGTIPDLSYLSTVEKFWFGGSNLTGIIPVSEIGRAHV